MAVSFGSSGTIRRRAPLRLFVLALGGAAAAAAMSYAADDREADKVGIDRRLAAALVRAGFTGRIESRLQARLGRPIDPGGAHAGHLVLFHKIRRPPGDNSRPRRHSPPFRGDDP